MVEENVKTIKNAAEAAREEFLKSEILHSYFEALYFTQLFEIILENLYSSVVKRGNKYFTSIGLNYKPEKRDSWTIDTYIRRLKTFFPKDQYKDYYTKLEVAKEKRNRFIHKCFKIKRGEEYGISLDLDKLHLNKESLKITREWITAYRSAMNVVLSLMLEFRNAIKKDSLHS